MKTRNIAQLPTGTYLAGGDVVDTTKATHDKYKVENLDFCTVLPEHIREGSKATQRDYMMQKAAQELAAQLLNMDGVFTLSTRYVIETRETRVYHRIKVLVIDK